MVHSDKILRQVLSISGCHALPLDSNSMGFVIMRPRRSGSRAIQELRSRSVLEHIVDSMKMLIHTRRLSLEDGIQVTKVVNSTKAITKNYEKAINRAIKASLRCRAVKDIVRISVNKQV